MRGSEEFDQTITELKLALHEQAERMRKLAASAAMNERLTRIGGVPVREPAKAIRGCLNSVPRPAG